MKFSYRQILASAAGAVLSAVIASFFGVEGTIIGVAIGSVAATTGSALVFQSIERTNQAVKHVVVRVPEHTRLLRGLGGTTATGVTEATPVAGSSLAEETATSASASGADTHDVASEPIESPPSEPPVPSAIRWPAVAAAVAAVFVATLVLVTVVELVAGRPLADLFGHSNGGTTVERIFVNNPTTTLPAPTTTTSTPSSSTTTTVAGETTTSTTGPGSTSTTAPTGSTSTTSSTSTVPGGARSG
jgi:hypothetical protein